MSSPWSHGTAGPSRYVLRSGCGAKDMLEELDSTQHNALLQKSYKPLYTINTVMPDSARYPRFLSADQNALHDPTMSDAFLVRSGSNGIRQSATSGIVSYFADDQSFKWELAHLKTAPRPTSSNIDSAESAFGSLIRDSAAAARFGAARSKVYNTYRTRLAELPSYWGDQAHYKTILAKWATEHAQNKFNASEASERDGLLAGSLSDIGQVLHVAREGATGNLFLAEKAVAPVFAPTSRPLYSARDDFTYIVDVQTDHDETSVTPALSMCTPEEPTDKHDPVWTGMSAPGPDNKYIKAAKLAVDSAEALWREYRDADPAARSDHATSLAKNLYLKPYEVPQQISTLARDMLQVKLQETADNDLKGRNDSVKSRFVFRTDQLGAISDGSGLLRDSAVKSVAPSRANILLDYMRRHEAATSVPESNATQTGPTIQQLRADAAMVADRKFADLFDKQISDMRDSLERLAGEVRDLRGRQYSDDRCRGQQIASYADSLWETKQEVAKLLKALMTPEQSSAEPSSSSSAKRRAA